MASKDEPKKDAPKLGAYKVTYGAIAIGGGVYVPEGELLELPEDEGKRLIAIGVVAPL